jgi:hypothetical protein
MLYGIRMFITVFTRALHQIIPVLTIPPYLSKIHFNINHDLIAPILFCEGQTLLIKKKNIGYDSEPVQSTPSQTHSVTRKDPSSCFFGQGTSPLRAVAMTTRTLGPLSAARNCGVSFQGTADSREAGPQQLLTYQSLRALLYRPFRNPPALTLRNSAYCRHSLFRRSTRFSQIARHYSSKPY